MVQGPDEQRKQQPGRRRSVSETATPHLTLRSWQATATYFCVMSISMSYKVVFSATWWVRTKCSPSEVWQDRQDLQRAPWTGLCLSPQGGHPTYLLGTAEVDALVSSAADHLDVSGSWKRRQQGWTELPSALRREHEKLGNPTSGQATDSARIRKVLDSM